MATIEKEKTTTGLPEGWYSRPCEMRDLEPMVELFADCSRALVGSIQMTLEAQRFEWESPKMDLANNTMAVFDENDRPVGYAEIWDNSEAHVRFFGWAAVHPEYPKPMIHDFLIDWLIQWGRRNVAKASAGTRVVLHQFSESNDTRLQKSLSRHGYQNIRTSYIMRIDFDGPPQPAQLPEGIIIRSIANKEEERIALYAAWEAFQDHWGFVKEPFETYYERRKYFMENDPLYDPSLWLIAWDGKEAAGISLNRPYLEEDPDQGWVGTLGVRRSWRKHGLGLALLQHSFNDFYQRGRKRVGLGVDASSLTGATRLYERGGMHVHRSTYIYELELRSGVDLMTQAVE